MNNNDFPQIPEGGDGRLRAMLASLKEDQSKLDNNPLYKEGYDDGFRDAQSKYQQLTSALCAVYNIANE